MSQQTIAQILTIEEEAVKRYEDARQEADTMIAEAKKSANIVREQTLSNMRQQAEQIMARGEQADEIERGRIIAQAEAQAQRLEATAEQHLDRAMHFVLDQVTGRR